MKKKEIFSIPNILSYIRLALVPVFLYTYLVIEKDSSYRVLTVSILAISSISDALDGYIARKYNMITNLGRVLDPVADKVHQLVLSFMLMYTYPMFIFPFIIMMIEDSILFFGGFYIFDMTGEHLLQAKMPGKVSTALYFVFSIILVAFNLSGTIISDIMIIIIVISVLYAVIFYTDELIKLYKKGKKKYLG